MSKFVKGVLVVALAVSVFSAAAEAQHRGGGHGGGGWHGGGYHGGYRGGGWGWGGWG